MIKRAFTAGERLHKSLTTANEVLESFTDTINALRRQYHELQNIIIEIDDVVDEYMSVRAQAAHEAKRLDGIISSIENIMEVDEYGE